VQPTGGSDQSSEAIPLRETWYPARRRLFVTLFSAAAAVMLIAIVIVWFPGTERGRWNPIITAVYAIQVVAFTLAAWSYSRVRLEADASGLHLVNPPRTTTFSWEDIAEIRPSIAKGKRTYLVLVRSNREVIDLPVTEEHLDELRRWQQAAT
jgi:hypothetical protein